LRSNTATSTDFVNKNVFQTGATDDGGGQEGAPLMPDAEARLGSSLAPGRHEKLVLIEVKCGVKKLLDGGIVRLGQRVAAHFSNREVENKTMSPVIIIGLAILIVLLVILYNQSQSTGGSTLIVKERGDWWGPWWGPWPHSGGHGAHWPLGPGGQRRMFGPGGTEQPRADPMYGPGGTEQPRADPQFGPGGTEQPRADPQFGPGGMEQPRADPMYGPGGKRHLFGSGGPVAF
jgi:hypothetical protein